MLMINQFSVAVAEKHIITDFNYTFESGNIYALLGENGSGKSSFALGLFGHPRYQVA